MFLIKFGEESKLCCMYVHDIHLDFVCLCRRFPTRLTRLLPSATECSDFKSAVMAAARPATAECLLQLGWRPLCWAQAIRRGGFSELLRGLPLSGHHWPTRTNKRQMHGADCHPPAIATAMSVSGGLLGLNIACSSHLSRYVVQQCYITPFSDRPGCLVAPGTPTNLAQSRPSLYIHRSNRPAG